MSRESQSESQSEPIDVVCTHSNSVLRKQDSKITETRDVVDEGGSEMNRTAPRKEFANLTTREHQTALERSSDNRFIDGQLRTVGTDPNFLESFFNSSRLSFIGSYKQRVRQNPSRNNVIGKPERGRRYVFHVDMDCFFAAVVLRNYPQHHGKPVAISHCGENARSGISRRAGEGGVSRNSTSECATCNYEARKFGVRKGMFLGRAKELCPELIVLHYDFEGYEEVSEQVADILYQYAGEFGGCVEQVSCDESYMEIWIDDCADDERIAMELATAIRKEISQKTQCTATIGVASNKLLAKLATDRVKPDGFMLASDYRDLLGPLYLRDLYGIGYRLEKKLADDGLTSVRDIWDLGDAARGVLTKILGSSLGKRVYDYCHGRDDRSVKPAERKTIGAEVRLMNLDAFPSCLLSSLCSYVSV